MFAVEGRFPVMGKAFRMIRQGDANVRFNIKTLLLVNSLTFVFYLDKKK